jgi:chromosome segregation ATPase
LGAAPWAGAMTTIGPTGLSPYSNMSIEQLEAQLQTARGSTSSAQDQVDALLQELKDLGVVNQASITPPPRGFDMFRPGALSNWMASIANAAAQHAQHAISVQDVTQRINEAVGQLNGFQAAVAEIQAKLDLLRQGGPDAPQPNDQLRDLLATGNIEAALVGKLGSRIDNLETQIKDQIATLAQRNADAARISGELAEAQRALAADPNNGDLQARVTTLKGQLDSLNSSNQLMATELQNLVNKRNQCFDMLSNLLNKLAKTLDAIAGNIGR